MSKKKLYLKLPVVLLGLIFMLASPAFAQAGLLDSTLNQATTTVNSLGLPVQLGTSSSGIPTIPSIDPNAVIGQTFDTVNSLQLPVQIPQVSLPQLPTTPAIDPGQVVQNTVDGLNNTVSLPVPIPNPIDILTQTGGTLPGIPGVPGLPGGTPPVSATGNPGSIGPNSILTPLGILTGGGDPQSIQGARTLSGLLAAVRIPASTANSLGNIRNFKVAPADPEDSFGSLGPVTTGLALLPLLGIVCIMLAVTGYFRSARNLWAGRFS